MTPRLPFLMVLSLAAAAAATGAQPDRFERTRARIQLLVGGRQGAQPLPPKPANPFYFVPPAAVAPVAAVVPKSAGSEKPVPESVSQALTDDDQILAFCAARLRITGQVLRAGVAHLMINASTYREGDLIPVRGSGDTVYYVKLVRIDATEAVFGYNDALLTVPLRS